MDERRKRFLLRGGLIAGLAVVVVGVTLGPALGVNFLTKKKANKIYLKKSAASDFLPKSAAAQFLPSSAGVSTAVASSTSLPGFQSSSQTPVDIPGASASVTVPAGQNGILLATFSGSSLCTNNTAGFNCPIKVTVDGASANPTPDSSGYVWDTTLPPASAPDKALSLTVSKTVAAGAHTVQVTFGGAGVPGTTFTLRTWHLTVQSFPG